MADMVAWLMSKTFSKKAGHHRTHQQTKTLLSLKLIKPTEHWRECLYLAEAYQAAKPENLHRPTKEADDIQELFESKLLSCIRRNGFVPRYRALPKNEVLESLSTSWMADCHQSAPRLKRHASVVANPGLLAEDRIDRPKKQDEFVDVVSVFDKLDELFENSFPGSEERELSHQKRVKNPSLLSTKNKRPN